MTPSEPGAADRPCAACGQPLGVADQFCPHCGAPSTSPPPPPDATTGVPPPPAADPAIQVPPPPAADPTTEVPLPPPGVSSTPPPSPTAQGTDWRRVAPWLAVGVVAILMIVGGAVLLSRDSGGGGDQVTATTIDQTATTVPADELTDGRPLTVPLVATPEATRVHPVSLSDGEITTVFVTGPAPFAPDLVVTGPDGTPLPANGVALGERGSSISFQPSDPGAHSVRVSGFSTGQPEYDIELRDGTVFTVPEELAVGDCVDRWDDERWAEVSGFLLVGCNQDHEGQVFEQVSGFGGSRQAAEERCDEARGERIALPGPVTWWSYWGDELTCIVVGGEGRALDRSLVSG